MPHLDDNEYSRMIEISENFKRGDVNMENIEINNDEEEKTPQDKGVGIRGEHQKVSKNEDEDKYNDSQRSFLIAIQTLPKIKHFQLQASSKEQHLRKTQSHQASIKLHKAIRMHTLLVKLQVLPEKIKMKSFRQEIVEQVKVRVEELQSRMKSKSDMFYVMRHMCKKYL